jgi:adenylate cyclase
VTALAAARRPLGRLLDLGTAGYAREQRRRLNIVNAGALLIALSSAAYAASYAVADAETYRWLIVINLVLIATSLCVPFMHRWGDVHGALLIIGAECPALFLLVWLLGRDSGIQLNLMVGAVAVFFIFTREHLGYAIGCAALCAVLHIAAWFLFPVGIIAVPPGFNAQLYVSSALTVFVVSGALTWYAFRLVQRAEAETQALLHNILPHTIVDRLREHPGEAIADAFERASILFSDIQGFVPLSRSLGAARTVAMLNELMRCFDALAERHGVEKIKTIGDAYMAVAGLPEPAADHADRLARMGLDMLAAKDEIAAMFGVTIRMRIGIASGPVMAGIIGTHKFSYDVWGDAVNLAARLESSGEAERIQLSDEARAAIDGAWCDFERRATDIKGVGHLQTWFLVPRHVPSPEGSDVRGG